MLAYTVTKDQETPNLISLPRGSISPPQLTSGLLCQLIPLIVIKSYLFEKKYLLQMVDKYLPNSHETFKSVAKQFYIELAIM